MGMKAWLALLLLVAAPLPGGNVVEPGRTPVLVELFTSEGCSSCPPADALLMKLNDSQPVAGVDVIALEEHVDYWDGPSWRDPFSSAELTARQKEYTERLHVDSPYTPEMVIDGHGELVGSDSQKVLSELKKAGRTTKTPVHVTLRERSEDRVSLAVEVDAAKAAGDVLLAITESKLASDVTGGENAGRNMKHSGVVRELIPIGKVKAGKTFSKDSEVKLARDWKPENLSAVVFVQERGGGKVLGAAEVALAR
jgi:hypothetical protein